MSFQSEVVTTLKRTAESIYERGGIIRKLDNLGEHPTPFRISSHNLVHHKAHYFVYKFDAPPECMDDLKDDFSRDVNIVRRRIYKVQPPPSSPCTLEAEMQPPAYRKEVQEMIEISKRGEKKKFDPKSGLTYYPFQK